MFLIQIKQEMNFFRAWKKHALCQYLLKSWVNENAEKNLKLIKQENYLKNIEAKSAQFNINENLSKQENIDIFTKSFLLEAPSIKKIYQETKK